MRISSARSTAVMVKSLSFSISVIDIFSSGFSDKPGTDHTCKGDNKACCQNGMITFKASCWSLTIQRAGDGRNQNASQVSSDVGNRGGNSGIGRIVAFFYTGPAYRIGTAEKAK